MKISFDNLRQAEGIIDNLIGLKEKIEHRINLGAVARDEKPVSLTGNKVMRLCLITGLALNEPRDLKCLTEIQLSKSSIRVPSSFFTYLELKGSDLRAAFEYMASTRPQCVSGARLVIKGGKLISAEVGGKPLDDSAVYGVGTIDFLLDGGDGFKLARNACKMIITDKKIGDVILRDIRKLTAEGKPLQYHVDGRITVEE